VPQHVAAVVLALLMFAVVLEPVVVALMKVVGVAAP
jgi:hypothetical protein